MDFPVHIATIIMDLSTLYYKGPQVEFYKFKYILMSIEIVFILAKPRWNAAISAGSLLFAKVPDYLYAEWKGLS